MHQINTQKHSALTTRTHTQKPTNQPLSRPISPSARKITQPPLLSPPLPSLSPHISQSVLHAVELRGQSDLARVEAHGVELAEDAPELPVWEFLASGEDEACRAGGAVAHNGVGVAEARQRATSAQVDDDVRSRHADQTLQKRKRHRESAFLVFGVGGGPVDGSLDGHLLAHALLGVAGVARLDGSALAAGVDGRRVAQALLVALLDARHLIPPTQISARLEAFDDSQLASLAAQQQTNHRAQKVLQGVVDVINDGRQGEVA
mmetsp:Transcript_40728/g.116167  ORF Transcript_40728/g.116167 Transcript_40728/m.116167 type:complete len:262 (+) Transcript_40728:559-1344(+)